MAGFVMVVVGVTVIVFRGRIVEMNRPAYEFWNVKFREETQKRMAVFVGVVCVFIGLAECAGIRTV